MKSLQYGECQNVEEKACGSVGDAEVPIKLEGIGGGGTEVPMKCEEKAPEKSAENIQVRTTGVGFTAGHNIINFHIGAWGDQRGQGIQNTEPRSSSLTFNIS